MAGVEVILHGCPDHGRTIDADVAFERNVTMRERAIWSAENSAEISLFGRVEWEEVAVVPPPPPPPAPPTPPPSPPSAPPPTFTVHTFDALRDAINNQSGKPDALIVELPEGSHFSRNAQVSGQALCCVVLGLWLAGAGQFPR